jgi:Bacterial archaeo-eukaryotic release factor family 10
MDRPYSVDERERQIDSLEKVKRKVSEEELPRPKSLLKALEGATIFSISELKALEKATYENPVISLYLRLSPEKLVPEKAGLLRAFHSLKTSALAERKEFMASLSRPQQETVMRDLAEIEAFLGEYLVPAFVHSLIVLKSGSELNRIVGVPNRTGDRLIIDVDPYVLSLEAILEESKKVLLIEVSKEESRLSLYHLGHRQEFDRIKSFVPTDTVDKSIPGKVQRHRLTHLQWHLKATADHAYRVLTQESCDAMVIMAEERVLHLFESFLPLAVQGKIIGRIFGSPDADTRDRRQIIEGVLRAYEAEQEIQAVNELNDYKPHQDVISGLQKVMEASNLFLLRRLVVSEGFNQAGFVCKEHHYLSLHEGACPFCNKPLLPVKNVVDEMVEIARLHGVRLTVLEQRPELLASCNGIAAVVYAPPAGASA